MSIERDLAEARKRNADRLGEARAARPKKPRESIGLMDEGFGSGILSSRLASLARFIELNPDHRYGGPKKDFKKYGITERDWRGMVSAQEANCAICGTHFEYVGALAIDHCHKTGGVRGLLCRGCNTGLGMFKDDPELMRRAISYLERHANSARPEERRDTTETVESIHQGQGTSSPSH